MVGLSRVLNAGFILGGQSVFQDVAAHIKHQLNNIILSSTLVAAVHIFKIQGMGFQLTYQKMHY